MQTIRIRKWAAIVLAFLLCVATMNFGGYVFAGEDEVTLSVGVPGLRVSISSPDLPQVYTAVTDAAGNAAFPELYTYLAEELHWDGSVPEPDPEPEPDPAEGQGTDDTENVEPQPEPDPKPYEPPIREIKITYDVNYEGVSARHKGDYEDGNARYTGTAGNFVLSMDGPKEPEEIEPSDPNPENPGEGTGQEGEETPPQKEDPEYKWTDTVPLEKPDKVMFLSGMVKMHGYNQDASSAQPAGGINVRSSDDEGTIFGINSSNDGSFEMIPYVLLSGADDRTVNIEETEYYYGASLSQVELKESGVILLREKFKATLGNDFTYGENIQFGYVKEPGDYTLNALEGKKLALSAAGPFEDSVQVSVDEYGNCSTIYVQNEEGDVSQPVSGILKLDQEGPVISAVDGVSETEGTEITFNAFGIFTNADADLTLRISVTDAGCGVEKLYMTGENEDGSIDVYQALSNRKEDGCMTSTFLVKEKEQLLKQTLKVVAVDYLGNESSFRLIRDDMDSSTITIEKNKPDLTDISVSGPISSNGWYRDAVTFKFSTMDRESGLKSVDAAINGHSVVAERFDTRENEAKDYTFVLTRDLISSLETGDGTYQVNVKVKDNCGNISTKLLTVRADIVPPHVSLSGITPGAYYQAAPTLTIYNSEKYASASGAAIYVTVTRNGVTSYTGTYPGASSASLKSEFSADGLYSVSVYAVDAAGNTSNNEKITFTVDGTAPVITPGGVTDAKPTEYGWYNTPLTYALTVVDETSGIASISVRVNGKELPYDGTSISITQEIIDEVINKSGTYLIEVVATDVAGNQSVYQEILKIDTVAPDLTLSGIEKNKHYKTTPTLTIDNNEKHYAEEGAYMTVTVERDGKVVYEKTYPGENQVKLHNFNIDGDYTITAAAFDAAGNKAKMKSIKFVKDTTAPVINISGATQGKYYNTAKRISIQVDERYFKTDKVKVEVTKTLDGARSSVSFPWENKGKKSINSRQFSQTGTYRIKVVATDEAGNTAKSKSLSFTVDTVAPQVEISGIKNGKIYTYDDTIAPVITYSDSYYAGKSLSMTRAGSEWSGSLAKSDSGSRIAFANFKKVRGNDGVYHLEVTVRDKAGNSTTKQVDFSVNRFGSTYSYNESIKDLNGKYVQMVEKDLVVREKNISQLESSTNEIKLDGQTVSGDVTTSFAGRAGGYNNYDHIYSPSCFEAEGVYQINVLSKDKAGNEMESQEDAGIVKFYVDRTAPVINVDGLNEKYVNAETLSISLASSDNLAPVKLTAKVNDQDVDLTIGEDGEASFTLQEGFNQKVILTATDAAGNSEVFEKTVSVTPNTFLYFVAKNKVALGIGVAVLAALLLIVIASRKKKEPDQEASK